MTPNYVSNSSTEVSQWCTCEGSGNEWQGCQRILQMFTNNICLREYDVIRLGREGSTAQFYSFFIQRKKIDTRNVLTKAVLTTVCENQTVQDK